MVGRKILVIAVVVVAAITVASFVNIGGYAESSKANDWWNVDWQYRKAITITNTGNALTDYQVLVTNPVYNETGLVGSWHFNEGTGTTAADSSGNANTGTLINGPAWVSGKFENALSFNGSNGVANSAFFNSYPADGTVQMWFNPGSNIGTTHGDIVMSYKINNLFPDRRFALWWESNDNRLEFAFNTADGVWYKAYSSSRTWTAGTWYHVTLTWGSGGMKIYINSVLEGSNLFTGVPVSGYYTDFIIGCDSSWAAGLNGVIDEVRIYNRALSPTEISALYQAKARLDYGDIRFIDSDGNTQLNYWQEADGKFWVKVPSIPSGSKTIYVYYGNPTASSVSDFNIFPFSLIKMIDKGLEYDLCNCDFGPTDAKKDLLLMAFSNDVYSNQNMPVVNVETDATVGNVVGFRPLASSWSGDGTKIAVGQCGNSAEIRIFETDTWTKIYTVPYPGSPYYDACPGFKGGEFLAVVWAYNNRLRVYDTSDWVQLKEITLEEGGGVPTFSPNGNLLVIPEHHHGVAPGKLYVIDSSAPNPANWGPIQNVVVSNTHVCGPGVAFSPNGKQLAVAVPGEAKVIIYDTTTWAVIQSVSIASGRPSRITWSALGIVVSCYDVGLARIIDPVTYTVVKEIGPGGTVHSQSLSFNLNRNYLAVGFGAVAYLYEVRKYASPEPTASIGAEERAWWMPTVTLFSPENNAWLNNRTVEFKFIPIDDHGFTNCSLWTNETGVWALRKINDTPIINNAVNIIQYTFASDGICQWNIRCYDNDSTIHSAFATSNWIVGIDTTPPTTTDNAPTGWQTTKPIIVTLTTEPDLSGINHTYYKKWLSTESELMVWSEGTSITLDADGVWNIRYYSVDIAGNEETNKTKQIWIDTTPPAAVTGLSVVTKTKDSITLTWSKSTEADFKQYEVYKATKEDFSDAILVTTIENRDTTTYTISNLSPGTTYYFKVKTVDQAGLSTFSTLFSATTEKEEINWLLIGGIIGVIVIVVIIAAVIMVKKKRVKTE